MLDRLSGASYIRTPFLTATAGRLPSKQAQQAPSARGVYGVTQREPEQGLLSSSFDPRVRPIPAGHSKVADDHRSRRGETAGPAGAGGGWGGRGRAGYGQPEVRSVLRGGS